MYGLQTTLEMAAAAARIAAASTMMAAAGTKLAPTLQRTQPRYQARDVLLMFGGRDRMAQALLQGFKIHIRTLLCRYAEAYLTCDLRQQTEKTVAEVPPDSSLSAPS